MSSRSRLSKKIISIKFTELLFILFAILTMFLIYFLLSLKYPFVADSAYYFSVIKQITNTAQLHGTAPYTLATPHTNFPIFYPQLFFIEVTAFNLLLGDISFKLITPLSGALFILSAYILAKHVRGKKIAILTIIALIGSYYIMEFSTRMEQEPTLFFLMVLFLYCFYMLIKSGNKNWVFVSAIILAGAIGLKQQWVFLLFFIVILLVIYWFLKERKIYNHISNSLMLLCIAGVIVSPVLIYQFDTTGTLFYPGGTPQSTTKTEETFAKIRGIQKYQLNPAWMEYAKNYSWVISRTQNVQSITKIIDTVNPLSGRKPDTPNRLFFSVFFSLALIRILKKKTPELITLLLLMSVLLAFYIILIPVWDYFIVTIVLSAIIFAFGISTFFEPFNREKIITPLILMILVVASAANAVDSYQYLQKKSIGANINMNEYEEIGTWIKHNVPENAVILTSRLHEISQFAERKTIWLNLVGGTELYEAFNSGNETRLFNTMVESNVSYVLITDWWTGNPMTWVGYMSSLGAQTVKESGQFEEVYRTKRVSLYRLNMSNAKKLQG